MNTYKQQSQPFYIYQLAYKVVDEQIRNLIVEKMSVVVLFVDRRKYVKQVVMVHDLKNVLFDDDLELSLLQSNEYVMELMYLMQDENEEYYLQGDQIF